MKAIPIVFNKESVSAEIRIEREVIERNSLITSAGNKGQHIDKETLQNKKVKAN